MITEADSEAFLAMLREFGHAVLEGAHIAKAGVLQPPDYIPGEHGPSPELAHIRLDDGRELGHIFETGAPWTSEEFHALISWIARTIREEAVKPWASVH